MLYDTACFIPCTIVVYELGYHTTLAKASIGPGYCHHYQRERKGRDSLLYWLSYGGVEGIEKYGPILPSIGHFMEVLNVFINNSKLNGIIELHV
jgi:hypothetical protein